MWGLKSVREKLSQTLHSVFDLESSGRVLVYSAIVGVVAGLGAAGFYFVLDWFKDLCQAEIMQTDGHGAPGRWWAVLLIPTLGGLLCGLLVFTFAPEAEGHGTDGLVKAFHRLAGRIRSRVPLVKTVASILTIGSGGSAGREGPIAQVGAGFGSYMADYFRLSDRERRILMLAGAAGGVGAMFHAPLGGALFAVEVLYASTAFEFIALVPCVVASVIAYSTFRTIFGERLVIDVPALVQAHELELHFEGPSELPFFLVFAIPCAAVGFLYVWTFYGMRDYVFKRIKLPNHVKPAIGGLMIGLIALFFPQIMSGGYETIRDAIAEQLDMKLMLILIFAKIIATSCTISSGGSGGVFAPSLFIGAMLGGAYGAACNEIFGPEIAPSVGAFVLVGMGAFFAGVAKVPLTALIIVCEMTHSYDLLAPLMLVSVINVALLSSRWTLYEEQVPSLIDSPAHLGEFVVDVLEELHVRDLPDPGHRPILIREETPLDRVLDLVANSQDSYFPVVDENDELTGIFSLADVRSALIVHDMPGALILAADIARWPVATVTPDDNLHTTLKLCTREKIIEIPVVETDHPGRIIRMLRRQEVLGAYDERMTAIRGD